MNKMTKIGILGGGVEGTEAVRYLSENGYADVTLFDEKEKLDDSLTAHALPEGMKFYGGNDYLEKAETCEVVFRSPGIHVKKLSPLVKKGVQITSTTQFFMERCPCKIIGVTGTKGKGTTSTLIYLMLKEAGRDVYLGGNIGQSPLSFLDRLQADSIVVLEMSSFQLQDLTISPHVAVVLRVSSDHLDYHADQKEYWDAKTAIVRYQKPDDWTILNQDYDYSQSYSALTKARKMMVSTRESVGDGARLASLLQNRHGAFLEDGKIMLDGEMIADVSKVALIGAHHLENVLPAVTVARLFDVSIPRIQNVLYSFAGLPHRLEFVREIKGVKYYNDSFSTTPDTSIAATYAFQKPVILIAGGSEKNADYRNWAIELLKNPFLKMVLLIGQTAERMEENLHEVGEQLEIAKAKVEHEERHKPTIIRCDNLDEALKNAAQQSVTGDVVVMSPAAASFGLFKNYKERGEKFREFVMLMDPGQV